MMMMFIRKKRWVLLKRPRSDRDADGVGEVELYNNVCNTVLYRRETVGFLAYSLLGVETGCNKPT